MKREGGSGVPETVVRVLLGVRGMDSDGARGKVSEALLRVPGVESVEGAGDGQLLVRYDPVEATVMDLIRAARRQGFLAGMA
jgi:copper chaperone